jgi:bacillithiol biosynthesis deacetylase BshB2
VQPVGDGLAVEEALSRWVGRTVWLHAEAIPGGFVRNAPVQYLAAHVRGRGRVRVGLRLAGGWVRVEDVEAWDVDPTGAIALLGYREDGRLATALEVSPVPLPEPEPDEPELESLSGAAAPRLLLFVAHPDDETFICGGAVAAFARAGGEVHLVCATRGEHGRRLGVPPSVPREALGAVREAELRAACRALGVRTLALLGLRDKCVEFEDEEALAARLARYVRVLRPDAILTFHPERGGHPDHAAVGRAATRAWRLAGEPTWHPEGVPAAAPGPLPRLYYFASREVAERLGPERTTVVDVAPVAWEKLRAHRAHRTQTELDRDLWDPDEARVAARFAHGREYYEQASPPYVPGERGLLGLVPSGGGQP